MIDPEPKTWRDLQSAAAQILREVGCDATVEKPIPTARGSVVVDVWAVDGGLFPTQSYVLECKHWNRRAPRSVVHAFRSVVSDSGANLGALISVRGFQAGAYQTAQHSNVRLLTWLEFQDIFVPRWFQAVFIPRLGRCLGEIYQYVYSAHHDRPEISRGLTEAATIAIDEWRNQHSEVKSIYLHLNAYAALCNKQHRSETIDELFRTFPGLPLRKSLPLMPNQEFTPLVAAILDARCLRDALTATERAVADAVGECEQTLQRVAPPVPRRPIDPVLNVYLEFLGRVRLRATYRAVAYAAAVSPQDIFGLLGDPCHEGSWVVSEITGEPLGYREEHKHPALRAHSRIIDSPYELAREMESATSH